MSMKTVVVKDKLIVTDGFILKCRDASEREQNLNKTVSELLEKCAKTFANKRPAATVDIDYLKQVIKEADEFNAGRVSIYISGDTEPILFMFSSTKSNWFSILMPMTPECHIPAPGFTG